MKRLECETKVFNAAAFQNMEDLYAAIKRFVTEVGPRHLIAISGNEALDTRPERKSGYVTVWYWEEKE